MSVRRSSRPFGLIVGAAGHPANEEYRAQVDQLAAQAQDVTGETAKVALVGQGDTGDLPAQAAQAHGIQLEVVRFPGAKKGLVLLPRRWVVERSFAWAYRFRRLARDYTRLKLWLAFIFWRSRS